MNLYTGNPDTDDSCVATDLEQRYRMFLAEGFTPGEAAREAKEIIKFEWLVDQGRDQDQAALLVQMPLRSMMMTTFSQKPADLGYPTRIQWLMDRGLYTFEEATVLAFHSFDVLVVMHDEEEVAAGRQHRIQDYFACNRHRRLRPASFHPLASVKGERAKVAAVKPTFREKDIKPVGSVPPVAPAPSSSSAIFANLDRYLSAPDPMPEEEVKPPVPEVPVEVKPTISNVKPDPVVAKKAKITPSAKPTFKWSWKSSRANLSTVASAFGQEDEEEATATLSKMVVPEPETVSTEEEPKSNPVVPDIPKVFNVPPPPLPIPPPTGSNTLDPALLTQPIFVWACPIIPAAVPEVTPEPPPLPPELPKPPEPEPEPEIPKPPEPDTVTTGPTKPVEITQKSKYSWVNPASKPKPPPPEEDQPRPIQSLAKPAATSEPSTPHLKWSSPIPTINTCGNNIVITPTPTSTVVRKPLLATPQPTDEFSLNWDKAWGDAAAAASSSGQQSAVRWANFKLVEGVEEDPDDPYGVKLLNRRSVEETVARPASPANKVDDLYAMMNRFQ